MRAFHLAVGLIAGLLLYDCAVIAGPREDAAKLILESGRDLNELPMYGGIERPEDFKEADEAFIAAGVERFGSREKASEASVDLGWRYFFEGDRSTAMKRFNQAWLLDPDNGGAYHGFAVLLVDRDNDLDGAEEMFERAVAAPRLTTAVYADYGKFLLGFRENAVRAEPFLRKAMEWNPKNDLAKSHLVAALYQQRKFDEACPLAAETILSIPANTFPNEVKMLVRFAGSKPCRARG